MTAPARTQHHWLAIAVATLWLISLGREAEPHESQDQFIDSSAIQSSTARVSEI